MTKIVFLTEGGGEQMFRDVEFLPEMLKPDKAVYELLGVNFEDVAVYSTSAGDSVVMERESHPNSQCLEECCKKRLPIITRSRLLLSEGNIISRYLGMLTNVGGSSGTKWAG